MEIEQCIEQRAEKRQTTAKDNEEHTMYWKNNSGYDNVVVREHVSVNIALFMKGHRLRINPRMIYLWSA
jgi:hypothetical protein